MVVPIKRIVSVKGDAMIPDDGAVVGNKYPECVRTGPDLYPGCQVGVDLLISHQERLIVFKYNGMKSNHLEACTHIDRGICISVSFRNSIVMDNGRCNLYTHLVSESPGYDQLVQV